MKEKVLLFGGTGVLGTELQKHLGDYEVWAPTREELDLEDIIFGLDRIRIFNPEIIIYSAGLIDTEMCENFPSTALYNNVTNIVRLVTFISNNLSSNIKLVYISTEYVFGGSLGNYSIKDRLDPINVYGKTKAAAEYIVSILPKHQIIRAPFFKKYHECAYTNQYVSRLTVEEAAKGIVEAMKIDDKIIHIAGERNSVYNHYKKLGIEAKPIKIPTDLIGIIPKDTSLIDSR